MYLLSVFNRKDVELQSFVVDMPTQLATLHYYIATYQNDMMHESVNLTEEKLKEKLLSRSMYINISEIPTYTTFYTVVFDIYINEFMIGFNETINGVIMKAIENKDLLEIPGRYEKLIDANLLKNSYNFVLAQHNILTSNDSVKAGLKLFNKNIKQYNDAVFKNEFYEEDGNITAICKNILNGSSLELQVTGDKKVLYINTYQSINIYNYKMLRSFYKPFSTTFKQFIDNLIKLEETKE